MEREIQTDIHTDRQRDRQANRVCVREIEGWTGRDRLSLSLCV